MRLICPNCDAQYEVDDSVIPDGGRDVQCSACGHTWFQPGARSAVESPVAAEPEEMPDADEWEAFASAAEVPVPPSATSAPRAAATFASSSLAQPDADASDDDDDETPLPAATSNRMLDESLLAILREEAEREAQARRAEGSSLETQPDLGLSPIPVALAARAGIVAPAAAGSVQPAQRDAQVRPDPADTSTPEGPRRDRLPDIEIINSTLRATSERGNAAASRDAPQTRARQRSGFRLGFVSVMLIAALGAGAYGFAPRLSAALPALEPTLARYVAAVDAGRLWLDAQMRKAIDRMQPEG